MSCQWEIPSNVLLIIFRVACWVEGDGLLGWGAGLWCKQQPCFLGWSWNNCNSNCRTVIMFKELAMKNVRFYIWLSMMDWNYKFIQWLYLKFQFPEKMRVKLFWRLMNIHQFNIFEIKMFFLLMVFS